MKNKKRYYAPITQSENLWKQTAGSEIIDSLGNHFIDFSSGCLIANSGHGNPFVRQYIENCLSTGVFSSYGWNTEWRQELIEVLSEVSPYETPAIHLLSTGSEAVEFAIKMACINFAKRKNDGEAPLILNFNNSFHGRTAGSQSIGGIPQLKKWLPSSPFSTSSILYTADPAVLQKTLERFRGKNVAAIIFEPYLGGTLEMFNEETISCLLEYCRKEGALLIADEVQSGFFRTGKLFMSCYAGLCPDVLVCGKGISSSLPLSAVITREDIMIQVDSNTISSTHSGNPLCCAAALGNIRFFYESKVWENVHECFPIMRDQLQEICSISKVCDWRGIGLAHALVFKDGVIAKNVVNASILNGLMLFRPVGPDGCTVKIVPPLVIEKKEIMRGTEILLNSVLRSI